jgi:hypothetical protein
MYRIFLLICFLFASLESFSQRDSIVAVRELQKLNHTFGYRIKMDVVREGSIVSLPNEKIQFNISEINTIPRSKDPVVRSYVVRFILAHEFAHQIQYYVYRDNPSYMSNDPVSRTVIETQADILASQMLWYVNFELFDYLITDPVLFNDIVLELLHVALEIGSNEHTIGTHPSKRDRALAFRLGLTNGLTYVYDQRVKASGNLNYQSGLTLESFKQQMDDILKFIDFRKDEDMLSWSYRQARKILNYDRKISNDIILITPPDKRQVFHTTSSYPYVDYDLTYMNIGNKNIDLDMEVFISLVNRENPNSAETYRKLTVNHYSFTLLPGETYRTQDKLRWDRAENDFQGIFEISEKEMPRIVYPSSSSMDAIYSCTYSGNEYGNEVYRDEIKFLNLSTDEETLDFQIYVNSILNECLLENNAIIQGLGEKNFFIPNTLNYDCSIQFDMTSGTTVLTDLQKNILRVELDFPNFFPEGNYVTGTYNKLKRVLDSEFSDCSIEEDQDTDSYWVTYTCNSYEVYLEGYTDDREKDYSLYFSIDLTK